MSILSLDKNYFELFGLEAGYAVELSALAAVYRKLQQQFHPDRFSAAGDREQRMAVQMSARINEAYNALSSPLKRAQYLLKLQDIDASGENTTTNDPQFLMQQIMLREQLSEVREQADPESAIESMKAEVEAMITAASDEFSQAYQQNNTAVATAVVARMQFLYKLLVEVERVEESIFDDE
ncbi:Co-chaperone protein HscB [Sinobacterium norvegicum]|uniref:Co-chaperone protein HscB homolog n=1 Tax=Sinobacterium norvegicum TaxID=1641715 RepID=A0ABM9AHE6_9GAMM|nr:Fe-S protein assembly co-chaperone HscB [Sinobacterium norvegicum]CAH0992647.1 Co-chaperone protein HscB [Sinobacterium norvegicum]